MNEKSRVAPWPFFFLSLYSRMTPGRPKSWFLVFVVLHSETADWLNFLVEMIRQVCGLIKNEKKKKKWCHCQLSTVFSPSEGKIKCPIQKLHLHHTLADHPVWFRRLHKRTLYSSGEKLMLQNGSTDFIYSVKRCWEMGVDLLHTTPKLPTATWRQIFQLLPVCRNYVLENTLSSLQPLTTHVLHHEKRAKRTC